MLIIGILLLSLISYSQKTQWIIDFKTGIPFNLLLPLEVEQDSYPDINISSAHFYSEPFVSPIVWYFRLSRWKDSKSLEFEFIHHKLFLDNKPTEIQELSVTHGYNLVMVNHAWSAGGFIFRAGAGITLVHPHSVIRGNRFDETNGIYNSGYYVGGLSAQAAVEKRFSLSKKVFIVCEGKVNPTYSVFPVYN